MRVHEMEAKRRSVDKKNQGLLFYKILRFVGVALTSSLMDFKESNTTVNEIYYAPLLLKL